MITAGGQQRIDWYIVPGVPTTIGLRTLDGEAWPSAPRILIGPLDTDGNPDVVVPEITAVIDPDDGSLARATIDDADMDALLAFDAYQLGIPWHVRVGTGESEQAVSTGTLRWDTDGNLAQASVVAVLVGPPGAGADEATIQAMVEDYLTANPPITGIVYDQTVAAATWTISHNLGRRPNVALYLDSGEQVDADVISTTTQVTITLPAPMTGQAILT